MKEVYCTLVIVLFVLAVMALGASVDNLVDILYV